MRVMASAIALMLMLAASAQAASKQPAGLGVKAFTLSADVNADHPNVAVDDMGAGHFFWDVNNAAGADGATYCRVPRGATACDRTQTFALPLEAFGEPQALMSGLNQVVLITHRCCGKGEGTYAIVSNDGGATFAAPKVIGTVEPGQAVYGPGTGVVSLVDDVVSGIHYQAAPLDSSTEQVAKVGAGPTSEGYSGTVGFPTANVPIVAMDDLTNGFWRSWSGTGNVNDIASWGPEQPLGKITELRMATGFKGVVLMGKEDVALGEHAYVARRFDTSTNTFGPSVKLSDPKVETDVIFRDIFEDAGGNIHAVWIANGVYGKLEDPLRYRLSTDGGKTWKPERTMVQTSDAGFDLQTGAGSDGGGWVVYDDNGKGPVTAVPIPPVGSQSGGGGGSGECVPSVSFGNIQALATAGCLQKQADGSYKTSDPVRINGLDVVPHTSGRRAHTADVSAQVVIDPVHKKVHIDAADVKAGNIVMDKGSFDWDVAKGTGPITTFTHLEKFKVSIFGFPVAGEATLKFDKDGAFIPAHLELPKIFGGITGDVTLRLKNPDGLELEGFKIHVGEAFLGALKVKPLDVEYKGSQPPVFEGSATLLLPPNYSNPGAHVSFGFVDGKFKHAEGSIPFDPPLEIYPPWAYLRQIGLSLSVDPLQIGGGVELIGGPQIAGKAAIAISALPPAEGFVFTFSDPAVLKISGSMKVVDVPFAHGFVEFRTSGLLKFGGGLDFTVPLGLASLTAGVPAGPPLGPGFVDLSNGKFNAPFEGDVCVPAGCGFIDVGSQGVISSSGIAACGEYLLSKSPKVGISAGFGYHWGDDVDVFGSFGGCDITEYAVAAPARAAQAGTRTVTVKAGLHQENILVEGATDAPLITVTAPDGETVSSGANAAPGQSAHMVLVSNRPLNRTTVMIGAPAAGTYTITTKPGSSPIARLGQADGLPEPAVSGTVTGSGHARKLAYKVRPIDGQTVRFVERSAGAGADIGAASGASGTLRFSPASGPKGTRQIVAMVEQNGVPRRQLVIATYVAPAPLRAGRPRFVRARRAGSAMKVTWGKAARAARYLVRIRLHDGTSKLYVVSGKKRSLAIKGVATRTFGTITVAGLTKTSTTPGPARKAGVKKKAKKKRKRRH